MAFAVVVSIMTAGAASAAIGFGATAGSTFAAAGTATATTTATAATTAGLGNIALSAAIAGFTSSIASQLTMTGSLNWGSAFEGAAVAGITAGLTNGITYNSTSGFDFTTTPLTVGGQTSSLASLAGVNPLAGTSVSQASASTATTLETRALAMLGEAGISAGVGTAIEGGSLGTAFKDALTEEAAAAGAFAIGGAQPTLKSDLGPVGSELAYLALHGALGCAAGAASGQGCGGGAIGGTTSALISPFLVDQAGGAANLTAPERAGIVAIATLLGGAAAGAAGQNAIGGATAAQNESLNNAPSDHRTEEEKEQAEIKAQLQKEAAALGTVRTVMQDDGTTYVTGSSAIGGLAGATNSAASGPSSVWDTSITASGSRFLNVGTNLTAQEFEQNLISNGYSITTQGTNTNGPFTVLTNGTSTYTTYIRSSTGESGAFFKGLGGLKGKFSFTGP